MFRELSNYYTIIIIANLFPNFENYFLISITSNNPPFTYESIVILIFDYYLTYTT